MPRLQKGSLVAHPVITTTYRDGAESYPESVLLRNLPLVLMLLPMLASMQPTPLPATLLAEVMSEGTRVYGAVNAPGWVMPVAAACAGLIPVSFLALSKGAGSPAVAVEGASIGTDSGAWRARDRLYAIANRHPTLWRRLRRE